ncbi:hypothetical protein COHA_004631 [Chlorella ohadii]|uniref:Uncharacterized protein n=1 Tax=Chlorella ohadii TaxID=2649997 RepID=A0AAD5DPV0_9CHLO|nr:hypothetical protein COHA_004631 [Chlorella ohadii]
MQSSVEGWIPAGLSAVCSRLKEAKLTHTGESDAEHNQAEIVAQTEAEFQDLDHLKLDVKSWIEGGESGEDERVVGLLTVRLLQAYHEGAGEPFDDENEDCVWRLGGFIPGWLVEALDHETLRRMIKAYMALPFSGV